MELFKGYRMTQEVVLSLKLVNYNGILIFLDSQSYQMIMETAVIQIRLIYIGTYEQ